MASPGPLRRWTADLVGLRATRPRVGLVVGLVGVVGVAGALGPSDSTVTRSIEALLLVVPVVAAAVLGGRWAAYVVAAGATLAYSLLVPPVGRLRVELAEDTVALVVFTVVAVVVGTLVSARIDALGRVEAQRRMLLRSVSHELRTPLAAITAASSELLDGADHDAATRRRLLELVEDESERLDRLVANLLSLSRVESGALVPNPAPVDLDELVVATVRRLGRVVDDRALTVAVDPATPTVSVDWVLMDQVLSNLIENAVRHSPPDGAVRVEVGPVAGAVHLAVSDAGPGVPPEDVDEIFEPFRSGRLPGVGGVGLAICKAVVEAHGGTISVSDAPGGGARFTVALPA